MSPLHEMLDEYFGQRRTASCVPNDASILKLGVSRNGDFKKALWIRCGSGMDSNKQPSERLAH